jgi:uncharacterized protein YggE
MNKPGTVVGPLVFAVAISATGLLRPAHAQRFGMNAASSSAQGNIEGLTVAGKGAVAARPNLLEIDLEVSAAAELTADAIVKYRDARRKLQEAFAALKLANVTVEERGLLVDKKGSNNGYYWRFYEPSARAKTEVQLSRNLVVKGTGIRKLDEEALLQLSARLLDVAQDAGARLGPANDTMPYWFYDSPPTKPSLVRFVIDDFDKLQEDAYAKAIADARSRAERLARVSGVELGPIIAVRETFVPGEREDPGGEDKEPRKRLVSAKFQEIPINVELLVRFEVHPKAEKKTGTTD